MPLSSQELLELKERCKYAHAHGFKIGLAEEYVATLEKEAGEVDAPDANSPAHLLMLIDAVLKGRDKSPKTTKKAEEKKPEEKKPQAPKPEEKKPEPPAPPPAPKSEEKKPEAPKAEEKKPEAPKAEAPASPEAKEPAAEPKTDKAS